jgi:PKD repeat protein
LNIDGDNDGNVDNVCFIIKGSSGAWASLLWAHRWSLYSQTVYIYGKRVYDYTFQPETQVNVKTLCHEMFHALGAPDLYHYSYDGFAPVGDWDLMESGFGHMSAFMKYKYTNHTWINDIPEITSSGTYTLKPLTSPTNNCYKIVSPNSPTEYFVLEYRVKEGDYESSIPGTGLLIYRINPAAGNGNAQGPPDEVYVYRPGGTPSINGSIGNATFSQNSGRTIFNNISDPKCFYQNGSLAGLDIYDIGTTGTTISFKVGYDLKPNANFTANKTTIKELETINFTNLSSGNPTSSLWNFGNGITSTELNPKNILFSNTGNYSVSLISANSFGSDTTTKENYIHVTPSLLNCTNAVNISFGLPYNGNTNSGQSNVNKYNCKTWSENGPEVVHTITTKSTGTIHAELSNLSINLDIFLLSSCKENSCILADNNSITYENAPAGTYYIVVDGYFAGNYTLTVSYSQTKIDEIYNNNYLSVFPNPNNGFFKLKLKDDNNLNTQSSLKIFSSLGKIVYADAYTFNEGEIEINLSFLPDGMYFIQLLLPNGEKYNGKIVLKK